MYNKWKNCNVCILLLIIDAVQTKLYTLPHFLNSISRNKLHQFREKCYDDLGCLDYTPEWYHPRYRPTNLMPSERNAINTIFIQWFMKDSDLASEVLGAHENSFSSNDNLIILVHDFTSNGYDDWIKYLCKALMQRTAESNSSEQIVSVQWALGAEPPFEQAVANTRLVALEINQFIGNVWNTDPITKDNVHIIGHGLGAHIAGYVGKLRKIQKITALDPTGPYFMKMPMKVRLHKHDAKFVEVLHTDNYPFGQGYPFILGHVDFFPNGGYKQPGCKDEDLSLKFISRDGLKLGKSLTACSHKRSQKYYIEAIAHPTCTIIGIACTNYRDFLTGKCASCGDNLQYCSRLASTKPNENTVAVGPFGFYFVTAKSVPFCAELIKVLLVFKVKPQKLYSKVSSGYFNVTIPQPIGDVSFLLNENHYFSSLVEKEHHFFLVFRAVPPPLVLPVTNIKLKWVSHGLFALLYPPPDVLAFVMHKITDELNLIPEWFCADVATLDKASSFDMRLCNEKIQDNIPLKDFFLN